MSAGYDAQLQNTSDRNTRQYSDLDLFFVLNLHSELSVCNYVVLS